MYRLGEEFTTTVTVRKEFYRTGDVYTTSVLPCDGLRIIHEERVDNICTRSYPPTSCWVNVVYTLVGVKRGMHELELVTDGPSKEEVEIKHFEII